MSGFIASCDPALLSAAQASAAIAQGKLAPETLAEACLERAADWEPVVRAFLHLNPEKVLSQARAARDRKAVHAMYGLPVGVKDVIDTFDMPTTHNSPIYRGHQPAKDAAVVAVTRALGGVIFGKTDTHEFAAGGKLPATTNPHDRRCTAGGSSSGSAAAVAAGMVPLAYGTQTAGSMLRPASFCGIFAMKPTFAAVSREGVKHYAISLDTVGWFGRSVADLAIPADGLRATRRQIRLTTEGVRALRFAVFRTPGWQRAEPEANQAVETVAGRLSDAGAKVDELQLSSAFDDLAAIQNTIMRGEGRAAFLDDYINSYDSLAKDFRDRVEDADGITFEKLRAAYDHAAMCRPEFDRAASEFDAVIAIGAPGEAPQSLQTTGDSHFQRMWTVLHVPAIAIPAGTGRRGLPIGVQLIAPRFKDAELIETAHAISYALDMPRSDPVSRN